MLTTRFNRYYIKHYLCGMNIRVIIFFLFVSQCLFAQNKKEEGIVIVKDKKIDALIQNRSNIRRVSTAGYRIQIYFDTDKDKVNETRLKFIKSYPKIESYITYDAPNYFLRVGDFSDKNDAEKFKKEIFREYPENFILKTNINVPNGDNESDDYSTDKDSTRLKENNHRKETKSK